MRSGQRWVLISRNAHFRPRHTSAFGPSVRSRRFLISIFWELGSSKFVSIIFENTVISFPKTFQYTSGTGCCCAVVQSSPHCPPRATSFLWPPIVICGDSPLKSDDNHRFQHQDTGAERDNLCGEFWSGWVSARVYRAGIVQTLRTPLKSAARKGLSSMCNNARCRCHRRRHHRPNP